MLIVSRIGNTWDCCDNSTFVPAEIADARPLTSGTEDRFKKRDGMNPFHQVAEDPHLANEMLSQFHVREVPSSRAPENAFERLAEGLRTKRAQRRINSMKLPNQADNTVAAGARDLKRLNHDLLVTAAKTGDLSAFVELRERHSTKILRTLYLITKNREDAEDALQETFLKVFIHLKRFETRSSFSSWATRIAVNSALMILRKKRTCREISIDNAVDDCDTTGRLELRDFSEDPEHCYARREKEEFLKRAMLRLRPALRDVIELRLTEESSMQELAECLGISMAAAKSRLLRAKVALRTFLV